MMKPVNFMIKNIVAFVLVFTLGFSLVPVPALADMSLPYDAATAANTGETAINTAVTAGSVTSLLTKETLDGIAWQVAKQMVSNMTRSLINWVNSGFEGSPAFVTDLNQMLLDSVDQVAGAYIESLGGVGEFICSPFRLDVQAALSINYEAARSGMPSGPTESMCTVTGIASNIENFLDGTVSSWDEWLTVTSNPQNTPYGAYLEAETKLNLRLSNAAGQELEYAAWGNGFLSKKVCEPVEGGGEQCKIVTPGEVISESLTFQLSTGQQSLVEADEINELIGALMQQLALKAVEGINGLLGLSDPDSSTGNSYLDDMVDEQTELLGDLSEYKEEMDMTLALEEDFLVIITDALASTSVALIDLGTTTTSSSSEALRADLEDLLLETEQEYTRVSRNITELTVIINQYESATSTASSTQSASSTMSETEILQIQQEAVLDYLSLQSEGNLTSEAYIAQKQEEWEILWESLFGE